MVFFSLPIWYIFFPSSNLICFFLLHYMEIECEILMKWVSRFKTGFSFFFLRKFWFKKKKKFVFFFFFVQLDMYIPNINLIQNMIQVFIQV
jgi:hypothetical protein